MALQAMVSGADCGPVNPLSQLSKAYHQDRSLQHDRYSREAGRPGPSSPSSSTGFRSSRAGPRQLHDEQQRLSDRFDMAPLGRALSPPTVNGKSTTPPPPAWAADFMAMDPTFGLGPGAMSEADMAVAMEGAMWHQDFANHQAPPVAVGAGRGAPVGVAEMGRVNMMGMGRGMPRGSMGMRLPMDYRRASPLARPAYAIEDVRLSDTQDKERWDSAFLAHSTLPASSPTASFAPLPTTSDPAYKPGAHSPLLSTSSDPLSTDEDELARTARTLLETVEARQRAERTLSPDEATPDSPSLTNEKFARSSFMQLMRKLRDGEVKVEGDKVVEQITPSSSVDKGKGRADPSSSSSLGGVWAGEYGQGLQLPVSHEAMVDETYGSRPRARASSVSALYTRPHLRPDAASKDTTGIDIDDILLAEERARVEEHEEGMRVMNEVMDADYAEREAEAARKAAGRFQGDGGAITAEMEDFMDAAEKANPHPLERERETEEGSIDRMMADTRIPGASEAWAEAMDQDQDQDERFDARNIVGAPLAREAFDTEMKRRDAMAMTAQQREWEALMADEDDQIGYSFQRNNPFLASTSTSHLDATSSRHHQLHSAVFPSETVLEKEAAVQQDPSSAKAWFELGIKQQENEREPMAIKALERAIELDPSLAGAALALAVSFTNEGQRREAFEALEKWVGLTVSTNPRYSAAAGQYASAGTVLAGDAQSTSPMFGTTDRTREELDARHAHLLETLIALARVGGGESGEAVDADVQIALGVLFNTSEEYEKAGDCFASALQTRPEDPLLYNRLGATLANSGKAEEAIQYYFRALELRPGYIRARYNLAISCVNLQRYREAAEHLLGALDMQKSDAARMDDLVGGSSEAQDGGEAGVMSEALWETLSMCSSLLQRADLIGHCERRDLDAFREEFQF